jgi:hypothetical protein
VSDELAPFAVDVPDAELRELRERLLRTRWPEAETVDDWSQGVPLAYLKELCGYWAEGYDWRGRTRMPCPWSSPTAGPGRSSSS